MTKQHTTEALGAIMETWELDRIYAWLGSAIGHNKIKNRKFYFDFSDKIFFGLIENEGQYSPWEKKIYDSETEDLLISKIIKIKNNDSSVLEIKKSDKSFNYLFDKTHTSEGYEKKDKEWEDLFDEIKAFLDTNLIIVGETRLIE